MCILSSQLSGFLQTLISHTVPLKGICYANLHLCIGSWRICRRWNDQKVNIFKLKQSFAVVYVLLFSGVLSVERQICISSRHCSSCHNLSRELRKWRQKSGLLLCSLFQMKVLCPMDQTSTSWHIYFVGKVFTDTVSHQLY